MGRKSQQIGDDGEHQFASLAIRHWGAIFVHTQRAEGTDGYLEWGDLPGIRLWVQVKSREQRRSKQPYLTVRIGKATTLRSWVVCRPLLVVCVPEDGAWWLDTAEDLSPWERCSSRVFRVPLSQPVAPSTRDKVRRAALRRLRPLPPFVLQSCIPQPGATDLWLKKLTPTDTEQILRGAYSRMESIDVHGRDVSALAVARLVHSTLPHFDPIPLDSCIELVSRRLLSPELGGRSFTLAALTSLLQPRHHGPFDSSFVTILAEAAEAAITRRTFLNPEFGLMVAAFLAEHHPNQDALPELVEHLAGLVIEDPQSIWVEHVARTLQDWLANRDVPASVLFPAAWLTEQITRPLAQDAEVFTDREGAQLAAKRVLKCGFASATPGDLELLDQLTRAEASDLLCDWISG